MDETLLESRARKWADGGKPWFGGLASGWERRKLQRSGVLSGLAREYLRASRRAQWIRTIGIVLALALLVGLGYWLWKEGVTARYVGSIVVARLRHIDVEEPEMVSIPGKPFAIGKHEVTFEQYDRYIELTDRRSPSDLGWGRGNRPVINVSWEDAVAYAQWLSRATGKSYRLPTEKEWEYAATSGGKDETWAGTSDEKQLADYAVFGTRQPEQVGRRKPNGLELHDMSGNLSEWVQDCFEPQVDEAACGQRVIRGGSWYSGPVHLRTSQRFRDIPGLRNDNVGFRLAQDLG